MRKRTVPIAVAAIALLICSIGDAKLFRQENSWVFSITDEITSKDVVETRTALRKIGPGARPLFRLSSPGGDIYAAMEIGRLIRKARGICIVAVRQQCASACVFVLAGAVERSVYGEVVIHRPYSTHVGRRDYESAENEYRGTDAAARLYLKEMNLPEQLFEAMLRVPPEQARILTRKENTDFGLVGVDPVEQEVLYFSSVG